MERPALALSPAVKVACIVAATAFGGFLGWVLLEIRAATRAVNEKLPQILANTHRSTETLAVLAEDIRQLRDLAGVGQVARDKTFVGLADSALDLVEASGGTIGLMPKVFGRALKDTRPAREWVVSARKEAALWLLPRVASREELIHGICRNLYGSDFYIQLEGKEPQKLIDWLRANHPEVRGLKLDDER